MRKLFLTFFFGLIMTVNFNAQTQDLDTSDRITIVENMNKYAIGIDTKDYELFRSIFLDDVEVTVIYDPNWRGRGDINILVKKS